MRYPNFSHLELVVPKMTKTQKRIAYASYSSVVQQCFPLIGRGVGAQTNFEFDFLLTPKSSEGAIQ